MKINVLNEKNFEILVAETARVLLLGGVVLLPTETVYGLMTLFGNKNGLDKIIEMKKSTRNRQFQLLINKIGDVDFLEVIFSKNAEILGKNLWPGGLTLVVENKFKETVGLRLPNHKFVRKVIELTGQPLFATSANISGEIPIFDVKNVLDTFELIQPDLVIDGGLILENVPSTVVSVIDNEVKILRYGAISEERIFSLIK